VSAARLLHVTSQSRKFPQPERVFRQLWGTYHVEPRGLGLNGISGAPSPIDPAARRASSAVRCLVVVLVGKSIPPAVWLRPVGGAVKPLKHAPESVHAAGVGRVGVVHDVALQCECTHADTVLRAMRPGPDALVRGELAGQGR